MFQKLKREFRLRFGNFKNWLADWELWFDQKRCFHDFRPALIKGNPGRVCKFCDYSEQLSKEDYYAYFGETGISRLFK